MNRSLLLTLSLLAGPVAGQEPFVGRAWLEKGDLCFDLPEGLVDWTDLARQIYGPALDPPGPEVLRQTYFESGAMSRIRFEAPVPPQVATRGWQLIHEDGVSALRPGRLWGEVRYDVDRQFRLRSREPSGVNGSACASSLSRRPAFVLGGTDGEWSAEVVPWASEAAGSFSFQASGERYLFRPPDFAKPQVRKVLVLRSGDRRPWALISWSPDLHCEGLCCEYAFSLFELGPGGNLRTIQENGYGCDV